MKLRKSDKVWMPPERQHLWVLVPKSMGPPKTVAEWKDLQVVMLERLVKELKAEDDNLTFEDGMLQDSELGGTVENPTFEDPGLPEDLLVNSGVVVMGSGLQRHLDEVDDLLKSGQETPTGRTPEATEWAKELSVATWLETAI